MKYLCAAVISAFLSLVSVVISLKIRKRAEVLEATYLLLNEIKLTLEYSCLPMYELICLLGEKNSYSQTFMPECKKQIDGGMDFPDAWETSVNNACILHNEEKQKLLQLGTFLGTSDLKSQISVIDMYIISFDEYRKEARLKSKKYADTCIYVGVFCALGLFVMMI
ncbi:MAG: stage III sporulation protein AB [Acutalibacteraceae bacterium]